MKSDMEKLREKQRRKRKKRMIRILMISPLIALAFVAALNLLFRINTLLISNETSYSSVQIASGLGFDVGDGILSFRRDKVASAVTVAYPYVKSVDLNYSLPGTVTVVFHAAQPALAVPCEDGILLLDEDFKVLEVVDQAPQGVLLVSGMDVVEYEPGHHLDRDANIHAGTVKELLSLLKSNGLYEHVSALDLSKKYNISMKMYDVITVRLGNAEHFPQKIKMLKNILAENDLTVPAEIRVRNYTEGRYVRLDPVPESSDVSSDDAENSAGS